MGRKPTRSLATFATRHRWWLTAGGALIIAVVLIIVLWPAAPARVLPPPRARQYLAFDACLLTGAQGISDTTARTVWDGMQDASTATRAKVSYLSVTGPQAAGNALPYVNTLLQRQCSLIIGVGKPEVDAIESAAKDHPKARFAVIGGTPGNNVAAVSTGTPASIRSSVTSVITSSIG
jgi:basic membrane lipoprotein Med (substrate-binding protein (PBP1-ABC) superfamily)